MSTQGLLVKSQTGQKATRRLRSRRLLVGRRPRRRERRTSENTISKLENDRGGAPTLRRSASSLRPSMSSPTELLRSSYA